MNDDAARLAALDPYRSFIVQAPAGSGKTELLTQRFLRLLTTVTEPEQIIAITFTRKAAAEMQARVLDALTMAQQSKPETPHKQKTWDLANAALIQDEKNGWEILKNPNRLRIITIDALAAFLSAQMPLLTGFGAKPAICQDPHFIYQKTVQRFFETALKETEWQKHFKILLLHLDNQLETLEKLLIQLLSKREQWLSLLFTLKKNLHSFRPILEAHLQSLSEEAIEDFFTIIPEEIRNQLFEYFYYAEKNLSPTFLLTEWPDTTAIDLWKKLIDLLLTQENGWRKQVTKNQGFPAPSDTKDPEEKKYRTIMKTGFHELLETLNKNPLFLETFLNIRLAPPVQYTEQQWRILEALTHLLPFLLAELQLVFQEHSEVDFNEINIAALNALGDSENITDLALYLDYKIQHLLVDEFQDTSYLQFQLFEKIITEWTPGDGHSLFLVGDPMQSIYRFRQAEVSLFLKVQQQGMGLLEITPLTLQKNFRTQAQLVDWFNATFDQAFPKKPNISAGAIPYSPAEATQIALHTHAFCYETENNNEEAKQITELISTLKQEDPQASIAILVRSRNHLGRIIPALQSAEMPYRAIDIDVLFNMICIQDLFALTRAYLHLNDRIAWLSILRAPWCGLTLNDLLCIAQAKNRSIWKTLLSHTQLPLSTEGKNRLTKIVPLLHTALNQQGRFSLSESIRGLWLALGGKNLLKTLSEKKAVEQFFTCLSKLEQDQLPLTAEEIERHLIQLFAPLAKSPENPVEIMTIHKSKGLEFDHVIIPSLEKKPNNDDASLLSWYEKISETESSEFILAPIKACTEIEEPINSYIRHIEKQRALQETLRVFYVACTRAKKNLYLFAKISAEKRSDFNPALGSLLSYVWQHAWQPQKTNSTITLEAATQTKTLLERLQSNHLYPTIQYPITYSATPIPIQLQYNFQRILGIVIHALLENLNWEKLHHWLTDQSSKNYFSVLLHYHGLLTDEIPRALLKIEKMLQVLQQDSKAAWIFSPHEAAQNEYALTSVKDHQHHVIDRTFIDDGIRWIIDYKTSEPKTGQTLEEFSKTEMALYEDQLQKYANLFTHENRTVKGGLYFPLLGLWIEKNLSTTTPNPQKEKAPYLLS